MFGQIRMGARIAALAVLTACAGSAEAHHSRAMFDIQKPVELTGTVREFQWTNPHCYIQLVVADAGGAPAEWSVEMGAPMHLQARGWTPRTIKAGDRITVRLFPLRNGQRGGELATATRVDGGSLGRAS